MLCAGAASTAHPWVNLTGIAAREAALEEDKIHDNAIDALIRRGTACRHTGSGGRHGSSADDRLGAFLGYFGSGNVEAMVDAHAADAIFTTPQGVLEGREQIRRMIGSIVAEFAKPGASFEIIRKTADGPVATSSGKAKPPTTFTRLPPRPTCSSTARLRNTHSRRRFRRNEPAAGTVPCRPTSRHED